MSGGSYADGTRKCHFPLAFGLPGAPRSRPGPRAEYSGIGHVFGRLRLQLLYLPQELAPSPLGDRTLCILVKPTPAIAVGLADHRWTLHELLAFTVPLAPYIPPKRWGRPPKTVSWRLQHDHAIVGGHLLRVYACLFLILSTCARSFRTGNDLLSSLPLTPAPSG